jgi:uncharacterized protein YcaQ
MCAIRQQRHAALSRFQRCFQCRAGQSQLPMQIAQRHQSIGIGIGAHVGAFLARFGQQRLGSSGGGQHDGVLCHQRLAFGPRGGPLRFGFRVRFLQDAVAFVQQLPCPCHFARQCLTQLIQQMKGFRRRHHHALRQWHAPARAQQFFHQIDQCQDLRFHARQYPSREAAFPRPVYTTAAPSRRCVVPSWAPVRKHLCYTTIIDIAYLFGKNQGLTGETCLATTDLMATVNPEKRIPYKEQGMIELSRQAARDLLLATQGLMRAPRHAATPADVRAAIQRMGVLQIDTINVVARSPYLVLWSRLGAYEMHWLDDLLAQGALFEFWAHEACFVPIEDYPLYRRLMLERRKGWSGSHEWLAAHPAEVERVRAHVRERGMARSSDFARTDGRAAGWWDWKIEKQVLEHMLNVGELMVASRHNFQRIYALREHVLPAWDDAAAPEYASVQRTMTLAAARCLGVATARWLPDYFRTPRNGTAAQLAELAEEGALLPARIAGIDEPAYIHPDHADLAAKAAAGKLHSTLTTLLSPFDPVVWDRTRAAQLFDFDYRIECYTPEAKRRYGYFTLPILRRGALIGRLDPKAHRQTGRFEVKSLHLEPGIRPTAALVADLADALHRCAAWHTTPEITLGAIHPPELAEPLRAALAPS